MHNETAVAIPVMGMGILMLLLIAVGAVISLVVFFLPLIMAINRKHQDTLGIGLLNFFLGWSMVGWVVALIWSLSAVRLTGYTLDPKGNPQREPVTNNASGWLIGLALAGCLFMLTMAGVVALLFLTVAVKSQHSEMATWQENHGPSTVTYSVDPARVHELLKLKSQEKLVDGQIQQTLSEIAKTELSLHQNLPQDQPAGLAEGLEAQRKALVMLRQELARLQAEISELTGGQGGTTPSSETSEKLPAIQRQMELQRGEIQLEEPTADTKLPDTTTDSPVPSAEVPLPVPLL